MHQQVFNERVEQVAGQIHNHHYAPEASIPDDAEVAVVCPQCQRQTWRYTQHCRHCHLDIFAWRQAREHEEQMARQARELQDQRKLAGCMFAGLAVVALGSWFGNAPIFFAIATIMALAFGARMLR